MTDQDNRRALARLWFLSDKVESASREWHETLDELIRPDCECPQCTRLRACRKLLRGTIAVLDQACDEQRNVTPIPELTGHKF